MPVSDEMRAVEAEIDEAIRSQPMWRNDRYKVLRAIMGLYRDAIELVHVRAMDAELFESSEALYSVVGKEDRARVGIFWALKWATAYCHLTTSIDAVRPEDLVSTLLLGETYDALVDVLKYADMGFAELSVDRERNEITCYEGNDLTGFDADIVEHQQAVGPVHLHSSLTTDSDQLTSDWCAGDYRRVAHRLASYAAAQENRIGIRPDVGEELEIGPVSIPKPTLVWLDRPNHKPDARVFDALTMPTEMSVKFMWSARSLLETPILRISDQFCALSSDLRTISRIDDYMLRLAARSDEQQYSRVSGLRENRMANACRAAFEGVGDDWMVQNPAILADPPQEADVVATRSDVSIVIELKSTLRPETLWEVYKRNRDIQSGVSQVQRVLQRGVADLGFVITDGYRGDYQCWAEALRCGIAIGTLDDLDDLARDPRGAAELMKQKVGITMGRPSPRRLPERTGDLLKWKLRLLDACSSDREQKR